MAGSGLPATEGPPQQFEPVEPAVDPAFEELMKDDESSEEESALPEMEIEICLDSTSRPRSKPRVATCNVVAGTRASSRALKMKHKDEQLEEDMRDIMRLYGRDERAAARDRQDEILSVIDSLGGDSKSFRRERARCSRAIIAEMYSPPRVSELARQLPKYECVPGLALDLTVLDSNGEPWDFSLKRMRDKAEKLIATQQPTLLIGSPMCTAFSAWQHINRTKRPADVCERELIAGRVHLAWCCKLYKAQIARGAFFLHEHPGCATSWKEDCVREVLALKGVARVVADQCQLGQETEGGDPIRKPTGFMSNSPCILGHLDRRCNGRRGLCSRPKGGEHQLCNGKVARRASIFQRELCEAILRGIRDQLRQVTVARERVGLH